MTSPLSDAKKSNVISKQRNRMIKLGAYAIQGKGLIVVEKINGDYYNVVGLPLAQLNRSI